MTFDPLPPIRTTQLPPFHEMPWDDFERLTVDICQVEPGITVSQLHGTPGPKTDHGADVIAFVGNTGLSEVASCKRYPKATAGNLKKWSDEFLDHWESYWSHKGVRRFVLATSAKNIAAVDLITQQIEERLRFAALGVAYEIWDPAQLVRRLRDQRHIVRSYLPEAWVDAICGPLEMSQPPIAVTTPAISSGIVAQLHDLQEQLSGAAVREVEAAVEHMRAGRLDTVRKLIAEQQVDACWSQLNGAARAAVLRLAGSLALLEDDIDTAEHHSAAADAMALADEPRLAARIALERSGARQALMVLGDPRSAAGRHLQLGLLLHLDEEARAEILIGELLSENPDDPETLRLAALVRLGSNHREEALAFVERAERFAPQWMAIQRTGIAIRYALALSPSLGKDFTHSPNPVVRSLVREDSAARAWLLEALTRIDALLASEQAKADDRHWRLAILVNLPDKRDDALAFARELLREDPSDLLAIGWSLQRNLDVDLAPSLSALRNAYTRGSTISEAQILALALVDDATEGAAFLQQHLGRQTAEVQEEVRLWIDRLTEQARAEGASIAEGDTALADEDASMFALLEERLEPTPPHPQGLIIAEQMAAHGHWDRLQSHCRDLLRYQTAAAVRLAVHVAARGGDYASALSFLEEAGWLFGPELPHDMQRIRAEALARSGAVSEALQQAGVIAAGSATLGDQLFQAEIHARIGDVERFIPIVRKALAEGAFDPGRALQWSRIVQYAAPDLSRDLVRDAVTANIPKNLVGLAAEQAMRLGLDREFNLLFPAIQEQAEAGMGAYRIGTFDEVQSFIASATQGEEERRQFYLDGAIPIHFFAAGRSEVLLRQIEINARQDRIPALLKPRPIRHGARPEVVQLDRPWDEWRIHLDVTGLFEANRLGLLDLVEQHPNGVTISQRLPAILQEMQLIGSDGDPAPARAVAAAIAARQILTADEPIDDSERFGLPRDDNEAIWAATADLALRLRRAGRLSDAELEELGADPASGDDVAELPHRFVVSPVVLIRLAATNLLDRIIHDYDVRVVRAERLMLERAIADDDETRRLTALAAGLSHRIAIGIQAGCYQLLPLVDHGAEATSLIEQQLHDLLSLPPTDGGVVWFDDRHLSGFLHAETLAIVGVIEVLHALEQAGYLDKPAVQAALQKLHASGAALLPFNIDQIVEALRAAPVVSGVLLETADLRAIRRSFANMIGFMRHLKIGQAAPGLADRPDEDVAARACLRTFGEALTAVWQPGPMLETDRLAHSDWLWSNLAVLRLDRPVPGSDPSAARAQVLAMQIAQCLDKAIEIGGTRDERRALRELYLHWCWERMVMPRLTADSGFLGDLADFLIALYRPLIRERTDHTPLQRRILHYLVFLRADRLPTPLAEKIRQSGLFSTHVKLVRLVTVGRRNFDADRFWPAARRALRFGKARTKTADGRKVTISRKGTDLVLGGAVKALMSDELQTILLAKGEARRSAIKAFGERYAFDPDDHPSLAAIHPGTSDASLMELLHEARQQSIAGRLSRAATSLRAKRGAPLDELAPGPVEALASYYGFDLTSSDGPAMIDKALDTLIARVGIVEAVRRLGQVPVIKPFRRAAAKLKPHDVVAVRNGARTPWSLVVAIVLSTDAETSRDLLSSEIEHLLDTTAMWGEAFAVALRWTRLRLAMDPLWPSLSGALRAALTWCHAGWLVDRFIADAFDPRTLVDGLAQWQGPTLYRLIESAIGPIEQTDPRGISGPVLFIHGLAAICHGEMLDRFTSEVTRTKILSQLLVDIDEGQIPPVSVLLRRHDNPDVLQSALIGAPGGLFVNDPEQTRDAIIGNLLDSLEVDPTSGTEWMGLAAFASRGLDVKQIDRLQGLLDRLDLFDLAHLEGTASTCYIWRVALLPIARARQGDILAELRSLAIRCQDEYGRTLVDNSPGSRCFAELGELAAAAAGWNPEHYDEGAFAESLVTIADGWPDSVATVRRLLEFLLVDAHPNRFAPLWTLRSEMHRRH